MLGLSAEFGMNMHVPLFSAKHLRVFESALDTNGWQWGAAGSQCRFVRLMGWGGIAYLLESLSSDALCHRRRLLKLCQNRAEAPKEELIC